jgi:hypothetical protein
MRRTFALVGIVVPLLLAGCGGGGSSDSGSSGGSFVQAADAACAKANQEVEALSAPNSSAELIRYLGKTEAIVVRLGQQVEQLEPTGKPSRVYLGALRRSSVVLNEMFDAAQSKNPDAVGELSKTLAAVHLGRLARQAGLDGCAKPLEPGE